MDCTASRAIQELKDSTNDTSTADTEAFHSKILSTICHEGWTMLWQHGQLMFVIYSWSTDHYTAVMFRI